MFVRRMPALERYSILPIIDSEHQSATGEVAMKPLWPSLCLAQACVENSEAPKWIGCQHDFISLGRSLCRTNFTGV